MRQLCPPLVLVLLVPLLAFAVGYAQNRAKPTVGFVVDRTILAASVRDEGDDGLTQLAEIFTALGANITVVRVGQPIPDEVDIVVLANPFNQLSTRNVTRLWGHMDKGKHVLLALDPNGFASINSELAEGGLNQLLTLEYGNSLQDSFLIEPWFTRTSFAETTNTQALAFGDEIVHHPIIGPLINYDMPVFTWAARSITVDPFGPDTSASALIYSETAYGETGDIFNTLVPEPVQVNIGSDYLPRVLIGGIGINRETGSRVVLLGDSELLQNGFGLSLSPDTALPRFPGNYILMQRIAAWLLELPEADWPNQIDGFTWLKIDGDPSDWDQDLPKQEDDPLDTPQAEYDLLQVTSFLNDNYLYLMVETAQPSPESSLVEIQIEKEADQRVNISLKAGRQGIARLDVEGAESSSIPDAALAIGDVIEIRIPLRIVGLGPIIRKICLTSPEAEPAPLDCFDRRFEPITSPDRDPSPLRLARGPLAVITSDIPVNLRLGPGENYDIIGRAINGDAFIAVAKTPDGAWINVEDGRHSGWITSSWLGIGENVIGQTLIDVPEAPAGAEPSPGCTIISFANNNKRSGPGTNFDIIGQTQYDERFEAIARTTGADGYIWWQIEDGAWIRSDVVVETGNCDDLPVIVPTG